MPLQCAYYKILISFGVTGLAEERGRENREKGGGSLFTLQEKSHRGVEGLQSRAQPA